MANSLAFTFVENMKQFMTNQHVLDTMTLNEKVAISLFALNKSTRRKDIADTDTF